MIIERHIKKIQITKNENHKIQKDLKYPEYG